MPSYRIIPKPEVKDPEKARGWFERAQAEGVVAMRLVDARKVQTYTPGTWTGPYYGSLWGYYGYGWGSGMYIPPRVDEDALVTIETLIFSVPQNKLLWAGVSESKNPKGARQLIADLVKVTAKELQKQGLAQKPEVGGRGVFWQERQVLDPIERVSEVLFGLIMVLTFTGSLSVASPERSEVREMLVGAIGCNLAWGIVDAVMYVMSSVMLRARAIRLLKKIQIASDPAEARAAIAGMLSAFAVARLRPEILEMAREDLAAIKDAPPRAPITRDDCVGAVEVFLLVFLSTFPVVVPFIVMSDARAALRMSNWIAVTMLFIGGWSLGHYADCGHGPWAWRMAGLGAVLVVHHDCARGVVARWPS